MEEETIFPGKPIYINSEQLKIITHQKDLQNNKIAGTGFLCTIPGEYKIRKTVITAFHVLGENVKNWK